MSPPGRDTPIGGKPDPVPLPPLPPLFPVEALLRQVRLIHVAFLVVIVGLGTAWGLKLEYRMDQARAYDERLSERVAELERLVGHGILPLTEERLTRMGVRFEQVMDDYATMRERIEAVSAAVERLNLARQEDAMQMYRRRLRPSK
jgi:hypothetical protein